MKCERWFHVLDDAQDMYLSLATMRMLGVVDEDFPKAKAACAVETVMAPCGCR